MTIRPELRHRPGDVVALRTLARLGFFEKKKEVDARRNWSKSENGGTPDHVGTILPVPKQMPTNC